VKYQQYFPQERAFFEIIKDEEWTYCYFMQDVATAHTADHTSIKQSFQET
jgi:hypothetical protein